MYKSRSQLKEAKNWWICTEFEGLISATDYGNNITAPIDRAISEHNKFNLLFSYKDYQGWNPDAAKLSFESILRQAKNAGRIAYVNPPASKVLQMKLFKTIMPESEVRFFNDREYDRALHWIREQS